MVPRTFLAQEGLGRNDIRNTIEEERGRCDSLLLGEASDIGTDDGHYDRIVNTREGNDDAAEELAILVLWLSGRYEENHDANKSNDTGDSGKRLLEVSKARKECGGRGDEDLHDSLHGKVGSSKQLSLESCVAESLHSC